MKGLLTASLVLVVLTAIIAKDAGIQGKKCLDCGQTKQHLRLMISRLLTMTQTVNAIEGRVRKNCLGSAGLPVVRPATRPILGCNRPCPRIYRPVLASNGRKYSNSCVFNNAQCKNKSLKKCPTACNRMLRRVCAVYQGKPRTYSNYCVMQRATQCRGKFVRNGRCKM